MIAVAIAAPGVGLFGGGALGFGVVAGAGGFAAGLAAAAGTIGIGLVLTGVAEVLSPQPKIDSTLDESVQLESFTFSNVVNTSRQGMACPIAYGRVFVGSAVLSSGLDVDQVQV